MDNTKPRHIPYKLLKEITGGFSSEVGRGGFGVVYKGVDVDGHEIAVKLLHSVDLEDKKFRKEFDNVKVLKHPNIVQLVGFCSEDEEECTEYNGQHVLAVRKHRALCFEYMHNGPLDKYISDERRGLDWQERYAIIKGICEGLKYLHTGLKNPLCHLDLKPANILLDKEMVPKIADFGISRLIGENTKRTANLAGTLGYVPPEFTTYNLTSKEHDIYSLGVIIIMIMVGPRVYSLVSELEPPEFIEHVQKKWKERPQAIPGHSSIEVDCQQVKKCIEIALKCIDDKKSRRPTIGFIIDLLSQTDEHKIAPASTTEEVEPLKQSPPVKQSPDMATEVGRGKAMERKLFLGRNPVPHSFLVEITDNFSREREIGDEAWVRVYKGVLPNGNVIAVRKFKENSLLSAEKYFQNEVGSLLAVQHENIVNLAGYCHESQKKVVKHIEKYIIVDVTNTAVFYEYLPKGALTKYISGEHYSETIDWETRFKIILGICKGLHFLHKGMGGPVIHVNITSNNILLNDNWVPKIAEFGLSRLLGQEQTRFRTQNVVGSLGYVAPEYLYRGEISTMTDIYSLGILIMEITTREKVSNGEDKCGTGFVEQVRQVWTKDNHVSSKYSHLHADAIQQVKTCIAIGLECVDVDRKRRPSIVEILNKLNTIKEIRLSPISTELLDIYPPQLLFPFKPNKSISRSLKLINKSQEYVAVRLQSRSSKRYKMPLFGFVAPLSTYTLVVTTREQKKKPSSNDNEFLTLEIITVREGTFRVNNTDADSATVEYGNLFKRAKETDAEKVHELMLPVLCQTQEGESSDLPFPSEVEIITSDFAHVLSVDIHPTKPWIMTSHYRGNVVIWNYRRQEMVDIFKITKEPVYAAKFIEREMLLIAGDDDGAIYAYNYYHPEQKHMSIEDAHDSRITSLAVHPTEPFVLSSSDDNLIKLWNWENNWKATRTYKGHSDRVTQVNINPMDTHSFASVSLDHTIKIWSISSSECKITLSDYSDGLLCVQNYTGDNGKYLITGSWDGTAQVWELETKSCIETLKGHSNCISSVYCHPELTVLLTGSYDGTVRIWNSTNYRLENIIGINLGAVYAFGYIKDLRRIVVGCHRGVAMMEINLPPNTPLHKRGRM